MKDKYTFLNKLIENYIYTAPSLSSRIIDFNNLDNISLYPGDYVQGKAWLSSFVYTTTPLSFTPFKPQFKGTIEAGLSWMLNYMPVSKIEIKNQYKLAFLYPYESKGFNIKLSFNNKPIESYNQYMSLMYSKEDYPVENFTILDDNFKPFPIIIPKDMNTETIVDFKGTLSIFNVEKYEVTNLSHTAIFNYGKFIKDKIFCISIEGKESHILPEKFKELKNIKYNVKYGALIEEFKFESEIALPSFIPEIHHEISMKIGFSNDMNNLPTAFTSTPNYTIGKLKAISSCYGQVLFNYGWGNVISLSISCNLNDNVQLEKATSTLMEYKLLVIKYLKEYIYTNYKTEIFLTET